MMVLGIVCIFVCVDTWRDKGLKSTVEVNFSCVVGRGQGIHGVYYPALLREVLHCSGNLSLILNVWIFTCSTSNYHCHGQGTRE